jgi:type IV pilus assembly protein PilA
MFLQNLRARMSARLNGDSEGGFTLIELLVVMLILGILAAIAIPAFFNQRDKATDAQAKAAVRTAQTAMETFATEHGGDYTGANEDALIAIEPTLVKTGDNAITVTGTSTTGYTVTSTSGKSHAFSITRTGGVVTFPCTPKGGGCTNTADWSS